MAVLAVNVVLVVFSVYCYQDEKKNWELKKEFEREKDRKFEDAKKKNAEKLKDTTNIIEYYS